MIVKSLRVGPHYLDMRRPNRLPASLGQANLQLLKFVQPDPRNRARNINVDRSIATHPITNRVPWLPSLHLAPVDACTWTHFLHDSPSSAHHNR